LLIGIIQHSQSHVDLPIVCSRYISHFDFSLLALHLTTLSASEIQLSDHEDDQHGAESEVERVELDFDGHSDGFESGGMCR
jgi:hypothetical protein